MKERPWGMMRMEKLGCPSRERSCRSVQRWARRKLEMNKDVRSSFSVGREAWKVIVSSVRTCNEWEGDDLAYLM